jgi:hypothetical protein
MTRLLLLLVVCCFVGGCAAPAKDLPPDKDTAQSPKPRY